MSNVYEYRMHVKNCIMELLYERQLQFWNEKLMELSTENAQSYGRGGTISSYAIFFENKRWEPQHLDWTDGIKTAYCLPLNPKVPTFHKRMAEIAEELQELSDEKYEAERFLSNLVSFSVPPKRYKAVLGDTLYGIVREEIERHCAGFSDADWDVSENREFSMKEFIQANQEIIKAMNERVMLNLVTL